MIESKEKECKWCGKTNHTSLMCFQKPRHYISPTSKKRLYRKQKVDRLWFELNPPDERGRWVCYLQISPLCPFYVTRSTINLEHVKSKARHPELTFEVTNLRSACQPCNALKGSLDYNDETKKLT